MDKKQQNDYDEEAVYIRIPVSAKFISAALVTILVAFGSYPVVNRLSPTARNDPFTGSQGRELGDRIDLLEIDVEGCQERNATHRTAQAAELATLKAKTASNEYLIKRCMNLTRQ